MDKSELKRLAEASLAQAIVAAPDFCLAIFCSDEEILRTQYLAPCPELMTDNALAAYAVEQIRAYFAEPEFLFTLPLRPSGTFFQRRVWAQISEIACHQTRTYGELARALHTAPRAVGQACGANPFPLIVPCHRVLSASGGLNHGLGGFAQSRNLLHIKRWLLTHESR